ncbi:methylated-DNA--[protein]-cysteine S-methyltransferase [Pseudoalteromonas gelatinilytica]|uniref:Methylated-DNA--protein-cysteine methyltransferase n=1 Tax=Pseudoalteromonas gelatinilytica TaxID=1703256 RepID=A0A3A3F4W4_9GAMM|nr:methylated-DNA--[protein]-cysteine S-methyltransferase [Pseudoalteromonas profundi]RJF35844.1 methylated-DNA--[protein]-cysteine S-methyltransferase [Pseudoalteromonas profundi]
MQQVIMPSPIGDITIQSTSKGVSYVGFYPVITMQTEAVDEYTLTPILMCISELNEYFNGERTRFTVPLDTQGTHFQRQVWRALMDVEFGQSKSYQDIALAINNPKAVRAVGAANGKNPISIIVPCHRIIGANGKLTGYAGGLERKEWLLRHEGIL